MRMNGLLLLEFSTIIGIESSETDPKSDWSDRDMSEVSVTLAEVLSTVVAMDSVSVVPEINKLNKSHEQTRKLSYPAMVKRQEAFIMVTHCKARNKPVTADPVGQAHLMTLLGTPAMPSSSRLENILVTYLLENDRSSNINQTIPSPDMTFYLNTRILELLQAIQLVTPNVAFQSSITPNMQSTSPTTNPQMSQDINKFFHKVLYPTPNGLKCNNGITAMNQSS
jgi:hypothetical protein